MTTARRTDRLPSTRAALRAALGVLLVLRPPPLAPPAPPGQPATVCADPAEGDEPLVAVWDDGSITAFHGHVDLGTGLATALGQIVAEELDADPADVRIVLGSTALAPNQGATIASASIQVHADPLRRAAAQARAWLVANLGTQADACRRLTGRRVELMLEPDVPVKDPSTYTVVGTASPRVDLPAKARGDLVYVHDMRMPGMLHGRVVRPPYAGLEPGEFVGNTLHAVDEASIAHLDGVRAIVVIRDFVGIVAEREEVAERAMRELKVEWRDDVPHASPLGDLAQALQRQPAVHRVLVDEGDVEAALAAAAATFEREYAWPYQLHASIGPSCALAVWHGEPDRAGVAGDPGATPVLTVWAGTQNPHVLRADLARLTGLGDTQVDVIRMEAAGCYGRNGADDVAADAALLARAVGAPVRVQLTREQEHLWEPKGAAQLMQVRGALDAGGDATAYDFQTSYPSNGAPTLALLLTRTIEPETVAYQMGDRTAVPPYRYPALRVAAHDMAPILRASWLRGVSALPNTFAHESFIDELATAAGADPVAYRLRHLADDPRARELIEATAARAGWVAHAAPRGRPPEPRADGGAWLRGQGFAYARYSHGRFPGQPAAWAAWVADVAVDRRTGEVHVERIVVGQDAGRMINPAGVRHQVHGNVLQTTSRALKEALPLDPATWLPAAREWGAYPILTFREVPTVEVLTMPRPGEPPLGVGESASVPGTAAIANAVFDAIGVRLRQPPFTPEVVRAAMVEAALDRVEGPTPAAVASAAPRRLAPPEAPLAGDLDAAGAAPDACFARGSAPPGAAVPEVADVWPAPRRWRDRLRLVAAATFGFGAALVGLGRSATAPIAPVDGAAAARLYGAETVERGRVLAAAGHCVGCHTAPGGVANAGGRALETPFGTVWSTNLTPDPATGLGRWSLAAFQRAMREGVAMDGHRLYPAFPYTSYTLATDADLTAIYAWLMTQPPVTSTPPETRLAFPFNLRPALALWNALYLDSGPAPPVADRSAAWNRGAYLVDGLGHCGACHTPRDALGAERRGRAYLGGARVDGWEAPALTALGHAPRPWTEADLYDYLREGHSRHHGAAVGPMAPVVRQLQALPDADVRAMAVYLASFNGPGVKGLPAEGLLAETLADDRVSVASRLIGTWPDSPASPTSLAAIASLAGTATSSRIHAAPVDGADHRLFVAACAACHHDGDGPRLLGQNLPLALNTNLHGDRPDNLLRTILDGIRETASPAEGFMPAFRDNLDDRQIARLAAYLRRREAPDKPPWTGLERTVASARSAR